MTPRSLLILVGLPVAWHLALVAIAYVDASRIGMDSRKWAVVTFLVPLFGFFAYLFEREEHVRDPDDESDPFVDGPFEIHESRADDVVWNESRNSVDEPRDAGERERREDAGEHEPRDTAGGYDLRNDRDG